jgi:hypothetical protein
MKLINNRELLGNQKDTMLGFLLIFLHFGDRVLLCSLDWPQTLDPLSSAPPSLSPSPPYWDYRHALSCLADARNVNEEKISKTSESFSYIWWWEGLNWRTFLSILGVLKFGKSLQKKIKYTL